MEKELFVWLNLIKDEGLKKKALFVYSKVKPEFWSKPSSVKYHHLEVGGMGRHVLEVMDIACEIYSLHPDYYDCTLDDVIIAAFVHDFNKLYSYKDSEPWMKQPKYGAHLFMYDTSKLSLSQPAETVMRCAEWGLVLDPVVVNAVCYHHGGWSGKDVSMGDMHPLAVLLHAADLISGRCLGMGETVKSAP